MDETEAVGNLLNIKLYTDAPIAYVTCGQNVPDDMEMFNPQKTVKQILGGKEYRGRKKALTERRVKMDQAEQLRIIKANNQIRPTARVITVTSGKGGVGKSNMSINLAIQFRKMGKRVIILDADFGLANIEIMFGAIPKHNLCDLVYEGKSISDIITWGPMEGDLFLVVRELPGCPIWEKMP